MKNPSFLWCALFLLSCDTKKISPTPNKPTPATQPQSASAPSSVATKPASMVASAPASVPIDPLVRERIEVDIAGAKETWSLRWNKPPSPYCDNPEDAMTCPCTGFGYGESASLSLLRERPGKATETLLLDQFFSDGTVPSTTSFLPKQLFADGDMGLDAEEMKERLAKRPVVKIMELNDYNRDGLAAEFVLQVGAGPCGHRSGVLVGVDTNGGPLKVFGSVTNPGQPLVMEHSGWSALLSEDSVELVQVPCGDHGSDDEIVLHLSVKDGSFTAKQEVFDCSGKDGTRGKSTSIKDL
jgi:hypothetical protein